MLKYIIIIIVIIIISIIIISYKYNKLPDEIKTNDKKIFIIYNNDNYNLSIKDNKLEFIENSNDKLMIGNNDNLILMHNNLIYELGIDLQGNLIPIRIPEIKFSIYKNKIMCNNYLLLNNKLQFTPNNDNTALIKYC